MKYIVTVRGNLKDANLEQIHQIHDEIVQRISPMSRSMGATAHRAYLNPQKPGEFLAVDEWDNLEGLQKLYGDPNLGVEFGKMFDGMPEVTVWSDAGWFNF